MHQGLAGLLAAGVPVDDDRVQQLIDEHHQVTSLFWTPTRQTYLGLAQTYQHDERFASTSATTTRCWSAYLCDAMAVYAHTRLS